MTEVSEMSLDLEEISFRNLIWHYREELACIEKGAHARNLLNKLEKTHLGRIGILTYAGPLNSRTSRLTPKAKRVLDEIAPGGGR